MPKLGYFEALDAIANDRGVTRTDVLASAQRRIVWAMLYSTPDCLPDYRSYSATRADAISDAEMLYGDDAPRGFAAALRRVGIAATDKGGYYRVTVERITLGDLLP